MNEQSQVVKMERHMDVIRLMLVELVTGEAQPELEQYSDQEIFYHYTLLKDAGFIDVDIGHDRKGAIDRVSNVRVKWQGQEFYDASKESKIWKLAKENALKAGASFTTTVLMEYLKFEVRKQLHLP
jgi:hypothetical protein